MREGDCWLQTDLVLLEETEALALHGLGSLPMGAPLDGIAHGRHGANSSRSVCVCFELLSVGRATRSAEAVF
jgi:hypothetical protein